MIQVKLSRWMLPALLGGAGVLATALTACGETGPLQQPPPLFGAAAKRDYNEQKAAKAQAVRTQDEANRNAQGSADREANTVDNDTPLSTRDIQDPDAKLTTPRDSPVPGAPNPLGPNVSTTPPN